MPQLESIENHQLHNVETTLRRQRLWGLLENDHIRYWRWLLKTTFQIPSSLSSLQTSLSCLVWGNQKLIRNPVISIIPSSYSMCSLAVFLLKFITLAYVWSDKLIYVLLHSCFDWISVFFLSLFFFTVELMKFYKFARNWFAFLQP